MKILIDNGHGYNTPGKCSPDGRLREYKYTREVAAVVVSKLKALGYDAELVTPETYDVSLNTRVRRINEICRKVGAKNVLVVSIHNNAAKGDGKWHDATGWSGWVAPNASTNSKRLAQALYAEAERRSLKGNRSVPPCKYWVGNFAIIRDTLCPAVLTENLFQDNREDVNFLLSDKGREAIAQLHIKGVINYINASV